MTEEIKTDNAELLKKIDKLEKAFENLTHNPNTKSELAESITKALHSTELFSAENLTGLIKDFVAKKLDDAHLDKVVEAAINEKKDEFNVAVRKGLGLAEDRPVMMSELTATIRKAMLDLGEDKKTPVPAEMPTPDGNLKTSSPVDDYMKELGITKEML